MINDISTAIFQKLFYLVHHNKLIYNQCQEDPRLDKAALELKPSDTLLVITSAGCNILDYLLEDVKKIHAVDMNWRQNALLELKLVMIKQLDYEVFFDFFGKGKIQQPKSIYDKYLRNHLSEQSRKYWDKSIFLFDAKRKYSFYLNSTTGVYTGITTRLLKLLDIEEPLHKLMNANSIEEQAEAYQLLEPKVCSKPVCYLWSSALFLLLLGVPPQQYQLISTQYPGGIIELGRECLRHVAMKTDLKNDNYFWYLYLNGSYSQDCCPAYLKENNFNLLKKMDLSHKVSLHSKSIAEFFKSNNNPINKFVLLDHFDWLSTPKELLHLQEEWQLVFNNAASNARAIWRSGGMNIDWMKPVRISSQGITQHLFDLLKFKTELAAQLHQNDRYHTYGSFYIADINA